MPAHRPRRPRGRLERRTQGRAGPSRRGIATDRRSPPDLSGGRSHCTLRRPVHANMLTASHTVTIQGHALAGPLDDTPAWALAPPASPTFHRPLRDPQRGSDLPIPPGCGALRRHRPAHCQRRTLDCTPRRLPPGPAIAPQQPRSTTRPRAAVTGAQWPGRCLEAQSAASARKSVRSRLTPASRGRSSATDIGASASRVPFP